MATTKKATAPKKKTIATKPKAKATTPIKHNDLHQRLDDFLSDLKAELGEKKFRRRLKKAIKALTHGLEKKSNKAEKSKKVNADKKTATKKHTGKATALK